MDPDFSGGLLSPDSSKNKKNHLKLCGQVTLCLVEWWNWVIFLMHIGNMESNRLCSLLSHSLVQLVSGAILVGGHTLDLALPRHILTIVKSNSL